MQTWESTFCHDCLLKCEIHCRGNLLITLVTMWISLLLPIKRCHLHQKRSRGWTIMASQTMPVLQRCFIQHRQRPRLRSLCHRALSSMHPFLFLAWFWFPLIIRSLTNEHHHNIRLTRPCCSYTAKRRIRRAKLYTSTINWYPGKTSPQERREMSSMNTTPHGMIIRSVCLCLGQ
jgi:hypothetical protein